MVKANVDKILDLLRNKATMSVTEISKLLSLSKEDVEKSAVYLEDDGVVKIEHKFPNTIITLLKDPEMEKIQVQLGQETEEAYMPPPPPPGKEVFTNSDSLNPPSPQEEQSFEPAPEPPAEQEPSIPVENLEEGHRPEEDSNLFSEPQVEDNIILEPEPNESEIVKEEDVIKEEIKSPLKYKDEFSARKTEFPKYTESAVDKIDYLINQANDYLADKNFKDLNNLYRRIYSIYNDSTDLTINEKNLLANKINLLFDRIKRIYLIEKVM